MRERVSQLVVLTLFAALLASCRPQPSGDRLIVISPHPETMLYEYQWAFRPWYRHRTGRDIQLVWLDQGGTSKMQRYLNNEFERSPQGVGIDMIWGGGIDPVQDLARRGLLHSYRLPDAILGAIPPDYSGVPLYDSQHRWYGTMLVGFGIVYNRRVLRLQNLPTPQTWTDLTDPAFQSWIGLADPRQSGSSHMALEILLQALGWEKGWEIITAMSANSKTFSRLASDVPRDVALGEVACGPCIDAYAYAQMAFSGRDTLGYVMPEGLTVISPDCIGILKGAPNLEAARMFLEFVVTEPGQRLLMSPVGAEGGPRGFAISRMALLPKLYGTLGETSLVTDNPFRLKSALRYDSDKGSLRWRIVNDLIGALVIENHDLLQRAWRAVGSCESEKRETLCRRIGQVPVSEAEVMELARGKWSEPVLRNRMLAEWSRFAREKYGYVLRQAGESAALASAP